MYRAHAEKDARPMSTERTHLALFLRLWLRADALVERPVTRLRSHNTTET